MAAMIPTTTQNNKPAPPPDMFLRQRLKTNLMNRVMRALKEASDDDMRRDIIAEVAALHKLIGAKE